MQKVERRGPQLVDEACQVLHAAYEDAAVIHGWDTQARSRKPWAEVPEENKATMRAAVARPMDPPRKPNSLTMMATSYPRMRPAPVTTASSTPHRACALASCSA